MVKRLYQTLVRLGLYNQYNSVKDYAEYLKKVTGKESFTCVIDALNFLYHCGTEKVAALNFAETMSHLISHNIHPIMCFDGPDRELKKKEKIKKKYVKQKQSTTQSRHGYFSTVVSECVKLCEHMHISVMYSSDEADFACAKVCMEKMCDFVISKDTDLITLGCQRVMSFVDGKIVEFVYSTILDEFKVTPVQFVDICVLMGVHYVPVTPKIYVYCADEKSQTKYEKAGIFEVILDLIKTYGSIEELFKYCHENRTFNSICKIIDDVCGYLDDYIYARNLYISNSKKICIYIDTKNKFLNNNKEFDMKNIKKILQKSELKRKPDNIIKYNNILEINKPKIKMKKTNEFGKFLFNLKYSLI